MTTAIIVSVLVAALGSALVGGIFYAFSSFVMKALSHIPAAHGISAMQSINIVVLNRSFLGLFLGTAVMSVLISVYALSHWQMASAPYWLAGAAAYLLGTFAVTAIGNVPLNDRLAIAEPASDEAARLWREYLTRWTWLNTVRTAAAISATVMYVLGFVRLGASLSPNPLAG
ncbi:MAG: DUF1772 domain-containing protein [Burkholderiaceae bacterium]